MEEEKKTFFSMHKGKEKGALGKQRILASAFTRAAISSVSRADRLGCHKHSCLPSLSERVQNAGLYKQPLHSLYMLTRRHCQNDDGADGVKGNCFALLFFLP